MYQVFFWVFLEVLLEGLVMFGFVLFGVVKYGVDFVDGFGWQQVVQEYYCIVDCGEIGLEVVV